MKILLIAGHGASDPGAVSGAYKEAEETRNMVGLLRPILEKRGITVERYPAERNAYADYQVGKLLQQVNPTLYDYALEIHFNACAADKGDGTVKGTEIYVTTSEKGVGVEEAICKSLAALGFTNRGVRKKNFSVINAIKRTGVSAALLEVCFIDDADDMRLYVESRERVAEAIADGICEGFGINYKEGKTVETKTVSKPSSWAQAACDKAVKKGVVNGNGNGDMMWQKPITREEFFVFLDRLGLLK